MNGSRSAFRLSAASGTSGNRIRTAATMRPAVMICLLAGGALTVSWTHVSGARCRMMMARAKGRAKSDPRKPSPSPMYVNTLETASACFPKAVSIMRPPSMEPTGSRLKAVPTRPAQPASRKGCTSRVPPGRTCPSTACVRLPSARLPWTRLDDTGTSPVWSAPVDSTSPVSSSARLTAPPAMGPAAATSNSDCRLGTNPLMGVTPPKVPSLPSGMKYDGPSLTPRRAPMMR
mmetsp:Transcript_18973/g.57301  ORF Transcript_18973/g.57301 Transcript_18973/m.57301 type:complete len:232 (+) Transcript_18973:1159-1854(+)